ncbi:MAG: hypothetical protein AMS17_03030 [Spirochaetes bacterium DG_61]|jgi:5-methyltetrahydropteroyltriglutamate--homocysteine methyltransferase|nr:MAG: hypothetical protein AMS17_03030 [Spirochaetes bacterium DG_61]
MKEIASISKPTTYDTDMDYALLFPDLFGLMAVNFYIQLASGPDHPRGCEVIKRHAKQEQRVFIGVKDPINPKVETPEQVKDRVLETAEFLPINSG